MKYSEALRQLSVIQERFEDHKELTSQEEEAYDDLEDIIVRNWISNFENIGLAIKQLLVIEEDIPLEES